jgi:hypothetical protein
MELEKGRRGVLPSDPGLARSHWASSSTLPNPSGIDRTMAVSEHACNTLRNGNWPGSNSIESAFLDL